MKGQFMLRKISRRALLCVGCCLMLPLPQTSMAQTARPRPGSGYFMIGWNNLQCEPLNASLQALGYPTFSQPALGFGGGGHFVLGRVLLGGEGHALKTEEAYVPLPSGAYHATLEAGYGMFNVGYLLATRRQFMPYVMGGIGGGDLRLKINPSLAPKFDDVLQQPGRSAKLTHGGLLLMAALGWETWFGVHHDRADFTGVMLGVRGGYVYSPVSGAWHLDEQKLSGGPNYAFNGSFLRILLGIGVAP